MQNLIKQFKDLLLRVDSAIERLKIDDDRAELANLDAQMQSPDFWDDPAKAADVSRRAASLRDHIDGWLKLQSDIKVALDLAEMGDGAMQADLRSNLEKLEKDFGAREFELKLSGPYDRNSAILTIAAGAGGTDAQDWAEMLLRMYLRYAERASFKAQLVEQSAGEEAGIKNATIEVDGPFAYGKLKSEQGVHRLVRLSPFNADNLRQTSFALVDVLPKLERPDEFEIDPGDLRIDVFRSGGHGGQSVNTTDSAVRVTHLPTGTTVAIQNERSQLQNKEKAMAILKARLTAMMLEQPQAELGELKSAKTPEWGSQIRSYVLHPYTKVKDHRTGQETSDAAGVLDGNLEPFMDAYLHSQIGKS
jgi:peptide chain release factor 2